MKWLGQVHCAFFINSASKSDGDVECDASMNCNSYSPTVQRKHQLLVSQLTQLLTLIWAGVHCDCRHPMCLEKLLFSFPSPISRGLLPPSARRPASWTSGEGPLPHSPSFPQRSWDSLCQPLFTGLWSPGGSLGSEATPPCPLHSFFLLVLLYLLFLATINNCILYLMLIYLITLLQCNHGPKRTDIFHFIPCCLLVPRTLPCVLGCDYGRNDCFGNLEKGQVRGMWRTLEEAS